MADKRAISTPVEPIAGQEPDSPDGFVERAWTHYSRKEYFRAEADFRKSLELRPDHIDTLYAMGMTLQASGRQPEAIQAFEKVIKLLENAAPEDTARAHMLARLSRGHISRMKTGDWHLDQ